MKNKTNDIGEEITNQMNKQVILKIMLIIYRVIDNKLNVNLHIKITNGINRISKIVKRILRRKNNKPITQKTK